MDCPSWLLSLEYSASAASCHCVLSLEKDSDWPSLGGGMLVSTGMTGRPVMMVVEGGSSKEGGLQRSAKKLWGDLG